MDGLDLETIRHALTIAKANGVSEVEVRVGEEAFHGVFEAPRPAVAANRMPGRAAVADPLASVQPGEMPIPSPFVGYFRVLDPPLHVGQKVEQGEIVASIAALGLAHDVESPVAGEITEILVEPGQAVEYGQALAVVRE